MLIVIDLMYMRKKGGFTIVELLVVIVVIAVLATIGIISYNRLAARAYLSRSHSEMSSIAKAVMAFELLNERYPADVNRGIPPEVTELMNGSTENWPTAPWPNSVYDYDYWIDSDTGKEVVQLAIRFCPIDATSLSDCTFPDEPWAANFQKDSSYYWCIKGACRSHSALPIDYPGKCANCVD